jgi:hypothetical protein
VSCSGSILLLTHHSLPQKKMSKVCNIVGGVCSPVLANMTLDGLEKALREKFPKPHRKGSTEKINFVRFADDFIVTGKSKEVLENEVKPLVEQFIVNAIIRVALPHLLG